MVLLSHLIYPSQTGTNPSVTSWNWSHVHCHAGEFQRAPRKYFIQFSHSGWTDSQSISWYKKLQLIQRIVTN